MHTAEGTASPGAFVAACNDHTAFKAAQLDNVEATHVHPHEVAPGPTNAGRALAMLLLRSKQLLLEAWRCPAAGSRLTATNEVTEGEEDGK